MSTEPRRTICLERLPSDPRIWRAYLADAEHCGGCGLTPEEAIGWLVFNNPQRCGVFGFAWINRPPDLTHPEVEQYPTGIQPPFPCGDEEARP